MDSMNETSTTDYLLQFYPLANELANNFFSFRYFSYIYKQKSESFTALINMSSPVQIIQNKCLFLKTRNTSCRALLQPLSRHFSPDPSLYYFLSTLQGWFPVSKSGSKPEYSTMYKNHISWNKTLLTVFGSDRCRTAFIITWIDKKRGGRYELKFKKKILHAFMHEAALLIKWIIRHFNI